MQTCISSHGLKRSWRSCPRRVNAGNKNTPSTHHPRRRNVTNLMVGLKKRSPTQKSHPKVVNPRDIPGERKKKKNNKTNKLCNLSQETLLWHRLMHTSAFCLLHLLTESPKPEHIQHKTYKCIQQRDQAKWTKSTLPWHDQYRQGQKKQKKPQPNEQKSKNKTGWPGYTIFPLFKWPRTQNALN